MSWQVVTSFAALVGLILFREWIRSQVPRYLERGDTMAKKMTKTAKKSPKKKKSTKKTTKY